MGKSVSCRNREGRLRECGDSVAWQVADGNWNRDRHDSNTFCLCELPTAGVGPEGSRVGMWISLIWKAETSFTWMVFSGVADESLVEPFELGYAWSWKECAWVGSSGSLTKGRCRAERRAAVPAVGVLVSRC